MRAVGVLHRTSSHGATTVASVVNKVDRRRVLLTTQLNCCGKFGGKVPEENTPFFSRYLNFRILTVGQVEENIHTKILLNPSSCFDTIPACNRRTLTDRHRAIANTALAQRRAVKACVRFVHSCKIKSRFDRQDLNAFMRSVSIFLDRRY